MQPACDVEGVKHLALHLLAAAALAAAAPASRADPILITEVVTDPQADHSESAGGNGVAFDAIPGSGTISSVDEYVELFHAGTSTFDLTGARLEFLDSTPSTYVFGTTTSGELLFSPGSSVEAFAPGAFLVLGNPPGALNNAIAVVLRAADGTLLDRLDIQDGNAASALDESVARAWSGRAFLPWTRREGASPLAPGTPVPEPRLPALVLLSALAGAAATLRRGRRAHGRTPA